MVKTTIDELKKLVQKKKVIFGSSEIRRKLRKGLVEKIFTASNIPEDIQNDMQHDASLVGVEIENMNIPNNELGMLFKRAHPVLAIGILKD